MNFAVGFKEIDGFPTMPAGQYHVALGKAYEHVEKGYNCLTFPITYAGQKHGAKPSHITFVQPSPEQYESYKESFFVKLTYFKRCFALDGEFVSENYPNWENKVGLVEVGTDKNGYPAVLKMIPKSEDEAFTSSASTGSASVQVGSALF